MYSWKSTKNISFNLNLLGNDVIEITFSNLKKIYSLLNHENFIYYSFLSTIFIRTLKYYSSSW